VINSNNEGGDSKVGKIQKKKLKYEKPAAVGKTVLKSSAGGGCPEKWNHQQISCKC
jgi:hypothetical protein